MGDGWTHVSFLRAEKFPVVFIAVDLDPPIVSRVM